MICRNYFDFEENGEKCIISQIFPYILLTSILSLILLYIFFRIITGDNLRLMIEFLRDKVRVKENWGRSIIILMCVESIFSLVFMLIFSFWIKLKKIYLIRISDISDKSLILFGIGFTIGPILNLNFIIPEGNFLLTLGIFLGIFIIVTFLALLSLIILPIIGRIGILFSGMHPVILLCLILEAQICNGLISYIPLVIYFMLLISLVYLRINIDNFWIKFGEIYVKSRGKITKDEIEQLFSVKLDRHSASYLSTIFEKIGLKVKAKYRNNDVELFVVSI